MRQAKCHVRKRKEELHRQFMLDAFDDFEQVMPNREVRKMARHIINYILITLHPYLWPKCTREIMEKVVEPKVEPLPSQ
jgi:hypothetical protein